MKPTPQATTIKGPKLSSTKGASPRKVKQKPGGGKLPTPGIELFQRESDPLCHSVRQRLSELGLDFVAHTVPDEHPLGDLKHRTLVQVGGKDQIPFLIDHHAGVQLYKAEAILAYLDHEYGPEQSKPKGFLGNAARAIDQEIRSRMDRLNWILKNRLERFQNLSKDAQGAIGLLTESARATQKLLRKTIRDVRDRASRAEGVRSGAADFTNRPSKKVA